MPIWLHHAIEYGQRLAHAGDECYFPGLDGVWWLLLEDPGYRAVPSGHQRPIQFACSASFRCRV